MPKNKHRSDSKGKPTMPGKGQFTWKIASIAAIIISAGLIAKLVFFHNQQQTKMVDRYVAPSAVSDGFDTRVELVASRFRCACGGCGELPLDECTCDMPRGAVEEKAFIRNQLQKGLTIDQVVRLVDKKYGHMSG